MIKKRIIIILTMIQLGILALAGRLVQLQLVSTESFHGVNLIEASVAQRTEQLVIDNGRGMFVARNGEPLTYEYIPTLVLFPFLKKMDWPIDQIATIVSIRKETIKRQLETAKGPIILHDGQQPIQLQPWQMERINDLCIPGVIAVHKQYELKQKYAQHVIGLLGENEKLLKERYGDRKLSQKTKIGVSGLQSSFDEFLIPDGETKLLYHVDARGEPLFGMDVKYTEQANPFYPITVQTTIDRTLQQRVEQIVAQHGMQKGAVVLLDVKTNDVLALASAPAIDERDPYKDGAMENKALLPQVPGSVFKVVVAAAALEHGLIHGQTFNCDQKINGEPEEKKRGMRTFEDSFAISCNRTFGELGKQLIAIDKNVFETYAQKLGLLPRVGWEGDVYHFPSFRPLHEEKKGNIWGDERDKHIPLAVAQTSIGQKDVRVSPLAVANMMATIARGGEAKQVRIVQKMMYKDGTTFFAFDEKRLTMDSLRKETVDELQQLLQLVVTHPEGTGRSFQSLPYAVAGKSGTAQTGKNDVVNKWFAGYFPADRPKYALVVVQLETTSSAAVTNSIFADIVHATYELEQKGRYQE
ncbi:MULTISPECIES: penicillin-binding protein 2 [Anoxybacillus]|uniref:Penicillin-binding protein A n=1 Tax=Anoxybacillus ayderensis TaxID=265546 RepID=A0A0D0H1Z7_9BACL|nr:MULTISPECIES: penicillin-binding transpeptidase domain-containing protein [Anoxybacillus]EPZ39758.1 cell division protein FtsI/penicillin-binding protein 2 [Anoxybacillus ayderensis]KIP22081.1 Penicillin-binding protein A [Anoxybacillus ayderensis]NNU95960.1 penicillin-binding protein 2 [Anoxybacillus sp. EFIL]